MTSPKEQASFLGDDLPPVKEDPKPSKDSQRTTPRNKHRVYTHPEKVGKQPSKHQRRQKEEEQAGQQGFEFFRTIETYRQLYLPGLLSKVSSVASRIRDFGSYKDSQRIPNRQAALGAA